MTLKQKVNLMDLQGAIALKRDTFQKEVLLWASNHLRDYPWRKIGRSPYEILVAELLLKRTTATAVARVYEDFLRRFHSVESISEADEAELAQVLSKLGLQWQRAKGIKSLARYIMNQRRGEVPSSLNELLNVPGLGEYSARAVMCFGFGIPIAVLDANVARILTRVFQRVLPQKVPQRQLQEVADLLVPSKSHRKYNLGLLDLGALVCRYIVPRCDECTLNSICDFYKLDTATRALMSTTTKLHKIRLAKGVGLVQLANKARMSKLTIINIEAGRTAPRPETLQKLATALGVPVEELIVRGSK